MDLYEKLNNSIVEEAQSILDKYGLMDLLSKYGKPIPTGSFVLNAMAYRDLDIYIDNGSISEAEFFELGKEINALLKPYRMSFRNEFKIQTPNLPLGYYWGVYTNLEPEKSWKIDIWAMSSDQIKSFEKKLKETQSKMTQEKRLTILDIKNQLATNPERISSMIIYKAVLDKNIKSMEEFKEWMKEERGVVL